MNPDKADSVDIIKSKKEDIKKICNEKDPMLIKYGGGFRDLDVKVFDTDRGKMVLVYLYIDVRDAMGANAVNTMAEAVAPYVQELIGGKVRLRIISNLATKRLARSRAVWKKDVVGGDVIEGVLDAYENLTPEIRAKSSPSKLFQMFLLYNYGVATMDRKSFGQIDTDGLHFLRLSTATDLESIMEGISLMAKAAVDKKGFDAFIKEGKHLF